MMPNKMISILIIATVLESLRTAQYNPEGIVSFLVAQEREV